MKPLLAASLVAFALAAPALAAEPVRVGDLVIEEAWARATPPNVPTAAVYLTIANDGAEADRIVGIATPVAGHAMAHTTEMQGGVARMTAADVLEIPAGGHLEMKPGGMHVMLMDLVGPLRTGEEIQVTVTFEKAGSIEVPVAVGTIGAMGPE